MKVQNLRFAARPFSSYVEFTGIHFISGQHKNRHNISVIFHSEGQISRNSSIIISLFNCESLRVLILSQILQTLFQSHFLILLDIREHGQDRLDAGLLPDAAVHIVLRALHDHRGKGEHTDQVGDHHQAVEGIGNIPGELSFHNRTEKE